jgi:hypothetical protein
MFVFPSFTSPKLQRIRLDVKIYIYIQRHTVIISYIIIYHYALVLYIILKYFIFSYVFML